jgi:CelD/BcsL family acetyltransferase involved in cellulose biosynthesis
MNFISNQETKSTGGAFQTVVSESFERSVGPREWDDFVLGVRGDIYMTFDWCRIWWRHYGQGRALRLFVFRDNGRVVGLAPMFVERVRLGGVALRLAKRVGADHALTLFSLPMADGYSEIIYAAMMASLIGKEQCDGVWIGRCPGDDPTLPGLQAAAGALPGFLSIRRIPSAAPHMIFDLPASFETYLSELDPPARQNYRRRMRKLNGAFEVQTEVVADSSRAKKTFEEFQSAHAKQWTAKRKLGHFGDWPFSAEFNADLVDSLSKSGRFRMLCLRANGVAVAHQYAFVFGDRCYSRLTAKAVQHELAKYGLGILSMVQLIEVMIRDGIRFIEAGMGHYDHKLALGGRALNTQSHMVLANRTSVFVRFRIFLLLSLALDLVYYRIWFRRLARYCSSLRRPLWRTWIRSRL